MPQSSSPQEIGHSRSPDERQPRKRERARRARRACLSCRARKVRCNVVEEDPCSNCRLDMTPCVVPRVRRNRKIYASLVPALTASTEATEEENSQMTNYLSDIKCIDPSQYISGESHPARQRCTASIDTETNRSKDPQHGDRPREVSSLYDHFPKFIQRPPSRLDRDDIDYLHRKGAFKLPSLAIQSALIEAFIEYQYPYMPILHLDELLGIVNDSPKEGNERQISLLIYQAILFAGSSFVETSALEEQGPDFPNRRLARREFARRVMLLYDLNYEVDSISLIQTALLLSTWSDIPPDHKDSWYWMGQATSLSYAVGLNNDPTTQNLPLREQKLRKRIWWTCYLRDRLLALGLHRPTRIKDHEFSTHLLEAVDFETIVLSRDSSVIGSNCPMLQSIDVQHQLADICIFRAKLAVLIEVVLRLQAAYDLHGSVPNIESYERMEQQFCRVENSLESWKQSLPESCLLKQRPREGSPSSEEEVHLDIHRSHLHMLFHTMVYSLHRPKFLPSSPKQMNPASRLSSDTSGAKVLAAALNISWIARELRLRKLDMYLPVSGVTILFPAMVVSLLEMKCQDEAMKHGATSRFMACMKVMETLQQTYVAADVTMSYLKTALSRASIDLSLYDLISDSLEEEETSSDHSQSPDAFLLGASTAFLPETTGAGVMEPSQVYRLDIAENFHGHRRLSDLENVQPSMLHSASFEKGHQELSDDFAVPWDFEEEALQDLSAWLSLSAADEDRPLGAALEDLEISI